jgi:AraC family transcriptional regulator, regulatory protein of adaptative response / DNA-3-methyladenine glycosylase II
LSFTDIAFAAGFSSVRQFNDTIRTVFASTPSSMRSARTSHGAAGRILLRLPYRPPFDATGLLSYLRASAIPGVEHVTSTSYARSLRLPHGQGTVLLEPADGYVSCSLRLTDLRDLGTAVSRVRRLLDLDADPHAVDAFLSADPHLRPLVQSRPGVRVPGSVDGAETLLRALGHCSPGEPLEVADGPVTHLYPSPTTIDSPIAQALANGSLIVDVGRDPDDLEAELTNLVGPGVARYVVMRVLGAPDVPLTTDNAAWRPWRSYAEMHLRRTA